MGALLEFGMALDCHLRRVPYSGSTPVHGPYLPICDKNSVCQIMSVIDLHPLPGCVEVSGHVMVGAQ
jgi:hypothetical protein